MPTTQPQTRSPLRVLGIDTSLRSTGLGVVERNGSRLICVAHETLKAPSPWPHSKCLARIHEGVRALLEETTPDVASIEGAFHCRNARTAVILGQARGAAITACALDGLPVFEYAPRRVKQSVCATGAAPKEQVARMVVKILSLDASPPHDESDALALAICHLNSLGSVQALVAEAI